MIDFRTIERNICQNRSRIERGNTRARRRFVVYRSLSGRSCKPTKYAQYRQLNYPEVCPSRWSRCHRCHTPFRCLLCVAPHHVAGLGEIPITRNPQNPPVLRTMWVLLPHCENRRGTYVLHNTRSPRTAVCRARYRSRRRARRYLCGTNLRLPFTSRRHRAAAASPRAIRRSEQAVVNHVHHDSAAWHAGEKIVERELLHAHV